MPLKVEELELPEVLRVTPQRFDDDRGHFVETFNRQLFVEAGIDCDFVQDNEAFSRSSNVLRGLHFQVAPNPQAKLIRVIRGAIFDVAVDIRRASATFGRWCGCVLDDDDGTQLFIPTGFAHGYVTLVPDTLVGYKVDRFYDKTAERGIAWDDPDIGIDWPVDRGSLVLSEKDLHLPRLRDIPESFVFERSVPLGDPVMDKVV